MIFCVENEVDAKFPFDVEEIGRLVCQKALEEEACKASVSVNMVITDNAGIRGLNRSFRGIDKETDVLSFPGVSYERAGDFSVFDGPQKIDITDPETGAILLGDIVINADRVRQQAEEYGHSERREFAFLTAHSMLHLCGYDHMEEQEAAQMEEKQEAILMALGITRDA